MKVKNKKQNYINIGCASNDDFSQHLGVMLYSLLKNCSCPKKIIIYLMDGGISEKNKEKINSIIKKFNSKISYIKPDKKHLKGLIPYRHISIETYYRFSLIDNLKSEKLLYIDADLVVLGDIKELYDNQFEDNIVFAIKDPGGSKERKLALGIPLEKHYFNAGVMLINCDKWRKEKISKKTIEYIKENPEKIQYADQDGLNAILIDRWEELDPSWNLITRLVYFKYLKLIKPPNYEKEDLSEIVKKPKIIHYAGFIKPWFFLDPLPYKSVYWGYLKETPWKDYEYPDKNLSGAIKRIKYYLYFQYPCLANRDVSFKTHHKI